MVDKLHYSSELHHKVISHQLYFCSSNMKDGSYRVAVSSTMAPRPASTWFKMAVGQDPLMATFDKMIMKNEEPWVISTQNIEKFLALLEEVVTFSFQVLCHSST